MGPGADMAHLNAQKENKMDPTSERRFSLRKRIVEAGDERPSMLEDGILSLADDLVHSVWPVQSYFQDTIVMSCFGFRAILCAHVFTALAPTIRTS